ALNRRLELGGGPPDLSGELGGERRSYRWRGGKISYSVAGDPESEPLLLVHGIYAGASSFEFRKNFAALSESYRVYALDLLGCGRSEKPRRRYRPEDVTAQIEEFAGEEIGVQTHLVASSLSATLAMPAAVRSPRLFGKVVLICPPGMVSLSRPSGRLGDAVYGLLRLPVLGQALYHALASRRSIRYYLERMAYHDGGLVTDELVEALYRAAHGPGSEYLPAAFVAGKLNLGAAEYYPRVPHRSMIAWGLKARTVPVREAEEFTNRNPRSEPRIFRNAALLPHDERAATFNEEVGKFLAGQRAGGCPNGSGSGS
nr:alpha/beta fold hydrolase [Rubrobacter sp.]